MKNTLVLFLGLMIFSCNQQKNKKATIRPKQTVDTKTSKTSEKYIMGFFKESRSLKDKDVRKLVALSLNQEETYKSSEEDEFVTYLGDIVLEHRKTHVFKQFYTVQAAIQKHGHAEMILITDNSANYYDLETTENLPLSLKRNQFQFVLGKDIVNMKLFTCNMHEIVFSTKNAN